jgi:ubiquinone/menaquinone biosynthesis C-methylase UbiE
MTNSKHKQSYGHDELGGVYGQVPPDYWDNSYASNPLQRLYHVLRFKAIRKMLKALPRGAKILDVGCGSGFSIEQSVKGRNDLKVYGVDVTGDLINYALKRRPQFNFTLAYGEELPFEDNEFDAILYLDVIEHLVDPSQSLKEARRCLKENGFIIILVVLEHHPLFRIIWWLWLKLKGKVWHEAHLHIFSKKSLTELLNNENFILDDFRTLHAGMSVIAKARKR